MSSTFIRKTTSGETAAPDPHKYVNYTLGMLLGVDEFIQEHAYLSGHDDWVTRELLGYGTTSGLHVHTDIEKGKPRILVEPGVAVSPRGQFIRVTPTQYADLNDWLEERQTDIGSSSSNPLTAYVVLGYRACPSDTVLIAGELGRPESQTPAPARLSDDFTLDLVFKAPDQREEDALQSFIAWLRQVPIFAPASESQKDDNGSDKETIKASKKASEQTKKTVEAKAEKESDKDTSQIQCTTLEAFMDALLAAAANSDPRAPASFMSGSPPANLLIPSEGADEYWKTAVRVWTTQLRPKWRADCSDGDVPTEDRVLLAQLTLPLTQSPEGKWQISGTVIVDETRRPFLLHLRFLQEWMLGARRDTSSSGSVQSAAIGYPNIQEQPRIPISDIAPSAGQVLMFNGKQWQPAELATGNRSFVEHPLNQGRYRVAAAGYIRCNDTSRQASYNGLTAHATQDGVVNVLFTDYEWPNPAPYIVKVLAASHSKIDTCIVSFSRFMKGYFVLRVTDGAGRAVSKENLELLELMIEVSQYTVLSSTKEEGQIGFQASAQE